MKWESHRQFFLQPQGCGFPRKHSHWKLDHIDCGAISGWGLLLTACRQPQGIWRGRLWWQMPVKENQASCMQGDTAESCIGVGVISVASLSPQTSTRQLNNRKEGPLNTWHMGQQSRSPVRGALLVPEVPNNLEGLQPGEPSKCVNGWSNSELVK